MIRPISGEDEQYKYMLKILKLRFHNALGYEGDDFEFINTELIPQTSDHKYMDGHYKSGDVQYNPEFQSTPVYEPKMEDMYKYMIYSLSEEYSEFHSYIFATYPPTYGIREIKIGDVVFKPDFFFTKNFHASRNY